MASGANASPAVTKPVAGRPLPVANKSGKKFSIYMVAANNNPFWDQVKVGFDKAQKVLDSYGVTSTESRRLFGRLNRFQHGQTI
jgi:hypothetical protein